MDRTVGTITRAENGPLTISGCSTGFQLTPEQRLTAREVFEVRPGDHGQYTIRVSSFTPPPLADAEMVAIVPNPIALALARAHGQGRH